MRSLVLDDLPPRVVLLFARLAFGARAARRRGRGRGGGARRAPPPPLAANAVWGRSSRPAGLEPTPSTPRDAKQKYIAAKYVARGFVDPRQGASADAPARAALLVSWAKPGEAAMAPPVLTEEEAAWLGRRLIEVAERNDVGAMLQLLACGALPGARRKADGATALHAAAGRGALDACELLAQWLVGGGGAGAAGLEARDSAGLTPSDAAMLADQPGAVRLLASKLEGLPAAAGGAGAGAPPPAPARARRRRRSPRAATRLAGRRARPRLARAGRRAGRAGGSASWWKGKRERAGSARRLV